jgi:hypothetical protein
MPRVVRLPSRKGCITITFYGQRSIDRFVGEPPGELMDAYQAVVGDGKAEVSVGVDMGTKEYGNGVSTWVSCKLACGQDLNSMSTAVDLAGQFARHFARQQYDAADAEFQKMTNQKKMGNCPVPNFGG